MPGIPDDNVVPPNFRYSKREAGYHPVISDDDYIKAMKIVFNPEIAFSRITSSYKVILHIMADDASLCSKLKRHRYLKFVPLSDWNKGVDALNRRLDNKWSYMRACIICKKKYDVVMKYFIEDAQA